MITGPITMSKKGRPKRPPKQSLYTVPNWIEFTSDSDSDINNIEQNGRPENIIEELHQRHVHSPQPHQPVEEQNTQEEIAEEQQAMQQEIAEEQQAMPQDIAEVQQPMQQEIDEEQQPLIQPEAMEPHESELSSVSYIFGLYINK